MEINDGNHDLRLKINLFLDNELAEEDCTQLMRRLNSDPECSSLLNVERDFRDLIRTNFKRPIPSADLEKNIKAKLHFDH